MSLEAFLLIVAPSAISEIILQAGFRQLKSLNATSIANAITTALRNYGFTGQVPVFQNEIVTALIRSNVINSSLQFTYAPFRVDIKNVIQYLWDQRFYKIVSVYSTMMLSPHEPVQQLDPRNGQIMTWKLSPAGALGQPFIISTPRNNTVLTVGDLNDGSSIWLRPNQRHLNQQWIILPTNRTGNTFKIISAYSGRAIDVDANEESRRNTARIQQWQYHGRTNQLWRLTNVQP